MKDLHPSWCWMGTVARWRRSVTHEGCWHSTAVSLDLHAQDPWISMPDGAAHFKGLFFNLKETVFKQESFYCYASFKPCWSSHTSGPRPLPFKFNRSISNCIPVVSVSPQACTPFPLQNRPYLTSTPYISFPTFHMKSGRNGVAEALSAEGSSSGWGNTRRALPGKLLNMALRGTWEADLVI